MKKYIMLVMLVASQTIISSYNSERVRYELQKLVKSIPDEEKTTTFLSLIENIDPSNLDKYLECFQSKIISQNSIPQYTALLWASNFCHQRPYQRLMKILLQNGANPNLYTRCRLQKTALHNAALHNEPIVLKALLSYGADPNAINHFEETPLDIVFKKPYMNNDTAEAKNLECLRLLFKMGAKNGPRSSQ